MERFYLIKQKTIDTLVTCLHPLSINKKSNSTHISFITTSYHKVNVANILRTIATTSRIETDAVKKWRRSFFTTDSNTDFDQHASISMTGK